MSLWRRADRIDHVPEAARISLGEGDTPLVPSSRLGRRFGIDHLYFKLETVNPTASYKDRFACAAISHMVAEGKARCVATSSGNTGSSLAAYSAAAGIACVIAIVEGAPEGKLKQMLAYGATLFRVQGFGLDPAVTGRVFETIERLGSRPDSAVQISSYIYSPKGMSGVKTLAYELGEQAEIVGGAIDRVFCPAGGGGAALALARGFADLVREGILKASPRVEVVQPEGNDTIATRLREGAEEAREIRCTTRISGLQVPNVLDGTMTLRECRASGGTGHAVTDDEVWEAQRLLSRLEGIFCEPAGATSVAGALRAVRLGEIGPSERVVCVITGSGFKDPASVDRMLEGKTCPVVDLDEFQRLTD